MINEESPKTPNHEEKLNPEDEIMSEFEAFEGVYRALLPEISAPQMFKVTIDLSSPNVDTKFGEEFAFQLLIKSMISRIDNSTLSPFDGSVQNEYADEFCYFNLKIQEAFQAHKE